MGNSSSRSERHRVPGAESGPLPADACRGGQAGQVAPDFTATLRSDLGRIIAYASGADVAMQRMVAAALANEAVKPHQQRMIIELGGMQLLLPLVQSRNAEVARLAAHALANCSAHPANQTQMALDGAVPVLMRAASHPSLTVQQQVMKTISNLAVPESNKTLLAEAGCIPLLLEAAAAAHSAPAVQTEVVACLANLAVNDSNEVEIGRGGGIHLAVKAGHTALEVSPMADEAAVTSALELAAQAARLLRNCSVHPANREVLREAAGEELLVRLAGHADRRVADQAAQALRNMRPLVGNIEKQDDGDDLISISDHTLTPCGEDWSDLQDDEQLHVEQQHSPHTSL